MKILKITSQEFEHEIIHQIRRDSKFFLFIMAGFIIFEVALGAFEGGQILPSAIFIAFLIDVTIIFFFLLMLAFRTTIVIDRVGSQLIAKRMFLSHCYRYKQIPLKEVAEIRYIEVPGIEGGDMTYLYVIDAQGKRHLLHRSGSWFGEVELKSLGEVLARELHCSFVQKRTVSQPYYG